MANLRNPLLKSTGALVSGTPVLNVEKCLGVQKIGASSLLFIFDYDKVERNVIWEYALLVTTSTLWAAGTDKCFVESVSPTYVPATGVLSTSEDALNLNAVVSVGTDAKVNFIGGVTIYSIVFNVKALDAIKTVTWDYLVEGTRDAVLAELEVAAAGLVFLS